MFFIKGTLAGVLTGVVLEADRGYNGVDFGSVLTEPAGLPLLFDCQLDVRVWRPTEVWSFSDCRGLIVD